MNRKHNFIAIDALICIDQKIQYTEHGINREIIKLLSGLQSTCYEQEVETIQKMNTTMMEMCEDETKQMNETSCLYVSEGFSTGKWGCGSMLGSSKLKFCLQLLVCNIIRRYLHYHCGNDIEHYQQVNAFINQLKDKELTVGQFYQYIIQKCQNNPYELLTYN